MGGGPGSHEGESPDKRTLLHSLVYQVLPGQQGCTSFNIISAIEPRVDPAQEVHLLRGVAALQQAEDQLVRCHSVPALGKGKPNNHCVQWVNRSTEGLESFKELSPLGDVLSRDEVLRGGPNFEQVNPRAAHGGLGGIRVLKVRHLRDRPLDGGQVSSRDWGGGGRRQGVMAALLGAGGVESKFVRRHA
jgi:hypothetical protein